MKPADQEFLEAVIARRHVIAKDIMRLSSCYFNKIVGAVTSGSTVMNHMVVVLQLRFKGLIMAYMVSFCSNG